MAKLYFRYSAMDAGKTLDLIKVAHNYTERGQHAFIMTSAMDTRAAPNKIKSRIGIEIPALSIKQTDSVFDIILKIKPACDCILIDEIQFFTVEQIIEISHIVDLLNIPVICYGLRSDYCGRPFASSAQLLAIADTIEELKTICHCGKKATHNMLLENGVAIKKGDAIVVDNDELLINNKQYVSVCRKHWKIPIY